MTKNNKNTVVCILGMHRSGTSMITRILNICGVYIDEEQNLFPPEPGNEKGHWDALHLSNPDLDKKILGNMEHAVPILKKKGIDCVICIDSDELLCTFDKNKALKKSISNILAKQDKSVGVINVKSYETIVTKDQYSNRSFRSKWFKV